MTEGDIRGQVLSAVFADRDRSVEKAIELGIKAGIAFERERIRSILDLPAPLALQKAVKALAFHPGNTAESVSAFIATCPINAGQAESFRKMFRLVDATPATEETHDA